MISYIVHRKFSSILMVLILLAIVACNADDETPRNADCPNQPTISPIDFQNAPQDPLTIDLLTVINDCLTIDFSASGCDGTTWAIRLIDAGEVLESLPPQRTLRLSLQNEESCLAIVTQEVSFDISNLRLPGDEVVLRFENNEQTINYKY